MVTYILIIIGLVILAFWVHFALRLIMKHLLFRKSQIRPASVGDTMEDGTED